MSSLLLGGRIVSHFFAALAATKAISLLSLSFCYGVAISVAVCIPSVDPPIELSDLILNIQLLARVLRICQNKQKRFVFTISQQQQKCGPLESVAVRVRV